MESSHHPGESGIGYRHPSHSRRRTPRPPFAVAVFLDLNLCYGFLLGGETRRRFSCKIHLAEKDCFDPT